MQQQNKLAQLSLEMDLFLELCRQKDFVFSVIKLEKRIQYAVNPLYSFTLPLMLFAFYENRQRKDIFEWNKVAQELDKRNASFDERIRHIQTWAAFRDYHCRGQEILSSLKCLLRLEKELAQLPIVD